jgi:sugar transferase (PEP-CTERM system associated)
MVNNLKKWGQSESEIRADCRGRQMIRVFGHFVPADRFALALFEVLLMAAAAYLLTVPIGLLPLIAGSANFSLLIAVIAIISMVAVGLYNSDVFLSYRIMAIKTLAAFGLAAPVICLIIFIFGTSFDQQIGFWAVWYLKVVSVWCLCVSISHVVFLRLTDFKLLRRRVIVIGTGRRADRVRQLARREAPGCFLPVAFVACGLDATPDPSCSFELAENTDIERFTKFVRDLRVGEIVVAMDDRRGLPTQQLLRCKLRGIKVTEFLSFCERESGRLDVGALQPSWLVFSNGFRSGWRAETVKRVFDVVVSSAVLIVTAPMMILTMLLVRCDSAGPIFYRQERVGRFGKTFTLLKFRSMRVEAEQDCGPRWAAENDPRVTRVGGWIRKLRIDELPQLFNVLKGDMSFIGPRPERPFFVAQLAEKIRFYGARHGVKPGITGWAQINYRYGASFEDARHKLEYDLYYVKNHTLFLDIAILIATVRVIMFPSGAR